MAEEPPEGRLSPDLARLRDEVREARAELRGTVAELYPRIRDPFGIRSFVDAHPVVTVGVAAGCGLLVARSLAARAKAKPQAPVEHAPGADRSLFGSIVHTAVRTAAWTATGATLEWLRDYEPPTPADPG